MGFIMNPILISKVACTTKAANRSLMMGLAVIATAAFAVATTSCATTKGFGHDVKKVGGKIEHAAQKTGGAN
jgi:predicted small secreted protein